MSGLWTCGLCGVVNGKCIAPTHNYTNTVRDSAVEKIPTQATAYYSQEKIPRAQLQKLLICTAAAWNLLAESYGGIILLSF